MRTHLTTLPTEIICQILEHISTARQTHTLQTVASFNSLIRVGNHRLYDISIGFLYREIWLNTFHDMRILKRLIADPHLAAKVHTIFVYPAKLDGETLRLMVTALTGMSSLRNIDWPDHILLPAVLNLKTEQKWTITKYRCVQWW